MPTWVCPSCRHQFSSEDRQPPEKCSNCGLEFQKKCWSEAEINRLAEQSVREIREKLLPGVREGESRILIDRSIDLREKVLSQHAKSELHCYFQHKKLKFSDLSKFDAMLKQHRFSRRFDRISKKTMQIFEVIQHRFRT